MSQVALLDVNVLVALFDPGHVHHELAHDWFADQRENGWATCPLTENGFVRVTANPAYGLSSARADGVAAGLKRFTASGHHHFWADDLSICDDGLFHLAAARGHRQLTDLYLLALAVRRGGRLATFDRSIPLDAVTQAGPEHLLLIAPAD